MSRMRRFVLRVVSQRLVGSVRDVFKGMDKSRRGLLSSADVHDALFDMNIAFAMTDLREAMNALDSDADGFLSYDDYCYLLSGEVPGMNDLAAVMPRLMQLLSSRSGVSKLEAACRVTDVDGLGYLRPEEFAAALHRAGVECGTREARMLMQEAPVPRGMGPGALPPYRSIIKHWRGEAIKQGSEDGADPR